VYFLGRGRRSRAGHLCCGHNDHLLL
jgi:hypothetical protein